MTQKYRIFSQYLVSSSSTSSHAYKTISTLNNMLCVRMSFKYFCSCAISSTRIQICQSRYCYVMCACIVAVFLQDIDGQGIFKLMSPIGYKGNKHCELPACARELTCRYYSLVGSDPNIFRFNFSVRQLEMVCEFHKQRFIVKSIPR